MTDLPLFYRSVAPLNRESHRALRLIEPQRFDFARETLVIPAVVDEFGAACRHLPILFLDEGAELAAVFLTGFRPGRSALVDDAGRWTGRYLPAYLRRYPFILGEVGGSDPLVCVDEAAEGLSASETTEPSLPLFEADGGDTALLTARIDLARDYAAAVTRTVALGRALKELSLLRPLTAQGQDPETGEIHSVHGAHGVDEAALGALPEADFARLRQEGWLAAIYAHFVSLQAIADFTSAYAPARPA